MNAAEAIAELARRQIELERRIAALEQGEPDVDIGDWGGTEVVRQAHAAAREESIAMHESNGQLIFAAPTDSQRKLRTRLAPRIGFEHWTVATPESGGEGSRPLPVDEATKAYVEGGPLWLYHYDRTFVMSLKPELRAAMVRDVESVDPNTAQEFGRDVLKDEAVQDPSGAIDQDESWRDAHGEGRGAR